MTESRDYFPLSVKILVGVKGLEPPTSCSQTYWEYFFRSFIAVFSAF